MLKIFRLEFSSKIYTLIFLLVFCLGVILISFIFNTPELTERVNADATYYLKYATYINTHGIFSFPGLFKDYLSNRNNWYFPSPLRAGFIILSGLCIRIFSESMVSLCYLSFFSYCIFLIFSFYFSKKYFGGQIAVLFTMLLAFSPLSLVTAGWPLTESTLNMFSSLALWLFFAYLQKRSKLKSLLFVLVYSFTILIKETSVFLSGIFIIFLIMQKLIFKKPIFFKDFLLATILPFTVVGIVYFSLGIFPFVLPTVFTILLSPLFNPYALGYGSGPWFRYLIDYMILSPWVVILSIGYIFYYLASLKRGEAQHYFLLILIISLAFFNLFTKNIRYAMIMDLPMRLFSVLMLKELTMQKFPRYSAILTACFVILISVFGLLNFNNLFLQQYICDPISYQLLKGVEIIPYE